MIKYLLFGNRQDVRLCSWIGGGTVLETPVSINKHTLLTPQSPHFVLDPQMPHPQTKRLKILAVQLKVEIVMNPQLQSDSNDSSKYHKQSQDLVPRSYWAHHICTSR